MSRRRNNTSPAISPSDTQPAVDGAESAEAIEAPSPSIEPENIQPAASVLDEHGHEPDAPQQPSPADRPQGTDPVTPFVDPATQSRVDDPAQLVASRAEVDDLNNQIEALKIRLDEANGKAATLSTQIDQERATHASELTEAQKSVNIEREPLTEEESLGYKIAIRELENARMVTLCPRDAEHLAAFRARLADAFTA